MKFIVNLILSLIFLIAIQSCYHYKISPGIATVNLKDDYSKLNGSYANIRTTQFFDSIILWQALTKNAKATFVNQQNTDANKRVTLQVLNKKKIKIALEKNDTIIDTKILNGQFVDSAFYVKKRRCFIGLPPFYVRSHGYKIMIAKGQNDALVLDLQQHRFGWILLLHAGFTQPYTLYYAKEK